MISFLHALWTIVWIFAALFVVRKYGGWWAIGALLCSIFFALGLQSIADMVPQGMHELAAGAIVGLFIGCVIGIIKAILSASRGT
jgi:hypothetical protein